MTHSHALRIDGIPIVESGSLYDAIIRHPTIMASARELIGSGAVASRIEADQPSVYVFQKEFAVIPRDQPRILGSDRATTCHIIIVSSSMKLFCAHLDGADGQMRALMAAMRETFAGESSLDVHLAGGFSDDHGLSVSSGRDLLAELDRGWPGVEFEMKTACFGPLNSAVGPAPIVRALAFDTRTNELIVNGWFADRGENVGWRAARASYGVSPLVRSNDFRDSIYVPDREYLEEMLKIEDDRTLLQMTSTSPDAEHDTFCAETRATMRYLLEAQSRKRI
jgi:hypothetical protein